MVAMCNIVGDVVDRSIRVDTPFLVQKGVDCLSVAKDDNISPSNGKRKNWAVQVSPCAEPIFKSASPRSRYDGKERIEKERFRWLHTSFPAPWSESGARSQEAVTSAVQVAFADGAFQLATSCILDKQRQELKRCRSNIPS